MKIVTGNVCAPKGFTASGVHCGIKKGSDKLDLALIYSEKPCAAAAVYTKNLVKGAPIQVTRENIANGVAQAVICNSGNANTCNANGIEIATDTCDLIGKALSISPKDIIIGSTGVIGQPMSIDPIAAGIPGLVKALSPDGGMDAVHAIMTTDTKPKEIAVEFEIGGKKCTMGLIGKGSGMIHPNMATMLVFITTDVNITSPMLQKALSTEIETTFNMISVDGDTSTNDTVAIMANGMAGNVAIDAEGADFDVFSNVLREMLTNISRRIAADGEGASRLVECEVTGAKDWPTAKTVSKAVICSALVKAAMFGADANWGRVLCAIGYSGADVDVNLIDVSFSSAAGRVDVCKNGKGVDFSEEIAKEILLKDEIMIHVGLNSGSASATAFGCDLTYDYVKINGDYRS